MSSSFVHFGDNGFWARDGFVEASQVLLFEEIELQYQDNLEWLNEYKKELALQSLPLISGGMSMRFDEMLTDERRIQIVLELVDRITSHISSDTNYLTGKRLNVLRKTVREYLGAIGEFEWNEKEIERQVKDGAYGDELRVNYYVRGFDLLRKLIAGQIHFKAETPITYWDE
jgi:hypothetical protein